QRSYFQSGLGAYVAAGDVDMACDEGERRAGDLLQDPLTLRYLIDLARQAHRTELMTRYARALLQAGQRVPKQTSQLSVQWSDIIDEGRPVGYRSDETLPTRYADFRTYDSVQRFNVADTMAVEGGQKGGESKDDLDIVFQAFVESRQLS